MSRLDAVDWPTIARMTEAMAARGRELVLNAGVEEFTIDHTVTMRYVGQGYEVDVPLDASTITSGDTATAARAFADCYSRRFGRTEEMAAEVVTWRVAVGGERPVLLEVFSGSPEVSQPVQVAESDARSVWFGPEEGYRMTSVYRRESLAVSYTHLTLPTLYSV